MIQQTQNSYPMKEWHHENMKKTIVKYVTGLSKNANSYQKRQHKDMVVIWQMFTET